MPRTVSFAQQADATCPACNHAFQADVWLVVDADERPDLVERLRGGSLHAIACPQCGRGLARRMRRC